MKINLKQTGNYELIAELKTICRAFVAHDKAEDVLTDLILAVYGTSSKEFRAVRSRCFHIPLALENAWASLGDDNFYYPSLGDPEPTLAAQRMKEFEVSSQRRKRSELTEEFEVAILEYLNERTALLKEIICVIERMPNTSWRTEKLNGLRKYLRSMERLTELINWNSQ